jgi:chromosome segregation ATPase
MTLTIGLVVPFLAGCATTSDDLSAQVGGLRADVQRLTTEISQLHRADSRVQAELPDLWEELLATNDLFMKMIERLHEVERQVRATSRGPLAAQQAVEALRQRTQAMERRLHAMERRGSEPRSEPPSTRPPPPVTIEPDRPRLERGMSEAEVRARLGPPIETKETAEVIFWIYDEGQHVSFDRATGQVRGWVWW